MVKEGIQLCRMSAQDQVFAKGDLVFLFKDCFTVHNFACSKKFNDIHKRENWTSNPWRCVRT